MPIATSPASKPRRLRAAAPHGRGGASSLLRLSRAGGGTLPSGAALDGWVTRAAALLDEPALPMITPLMPSTIVLR